MKKYYFITVQKIWLIVCIAIIACIAVLHALTCFDLFPAGLFMELYAMGIIILLLFPSFIAFSRQAWSIDKRWAKTRFITSYNIAYCGALVLIAEILYEKLLATNHEIIGSLVMICFLGMMITLVSRTVKVFFAPTPEKKHTHGG